MISLNEVIGAGVFIHGVCVCNNIYTTKDLLSSLTACAIAVAGISIFFRLYANAALLLGLSEIVHGLIIAKDEAVDAGIRKWIKHH
jgi:hypothetical protein